MNFDSQVVSFDDETLVVVDENNAVLEYRSKADCHAGDGILHRAFSVFVFNDEGLLLLQQRSENKDLWPLHWSNSCCSHPRKGEEAQDAAQRRLREELGIAASLQGLFTFQYHANYGESGSEREMCQVFLGRTADRVLHNANEVADWKWTDVSDFESELARHPDNYTPWLRLEWEHMRRDHWPVVVAFNSACA